jgi:hypothetical protein
MIITIGAIEVLGESRKTRLLMANLRHLKIASAKLPFQSVGRENRLKKSLSGEKIVSLLCLSFISLSEQKSLIVSMISVGSFL